MSSSKKKTHGKPSGKKPAVHAKPAHKKEQKTQKMKAQPARASHPAAAQKPAPPVKPAAAPAPAAGHPAPAKPAGRPAKKGRKGASQRRGPGGELIPVGEILLPTGPQGAEEVQYLFRGCVAAEHPNFDTAVGEVLARRTPADPDAERNELMRQIETMAKRFEGSIEALLPNRPTLPRRTFQTVIDRAKLRRREIGAFLRGLDLGRTESSHMDSHGEASLQTLMEWAARLENLAEADEPDQADYAQFHRGLDQLENTTEALIVDVEATLRRLRDRVRS
jgi:hypothetical protein